MLLNLIYSNLFIILVSVTFLYKSACPAMIGFYERMLALRSARRMYSLLIFLFLVVFHFCHLAVFKNHYDVIASTVLVYALASHKIFERIVRILQNRRLLPLVMLAALTCLMTPLLFTLGVTLGVLILATVFYPSGAAIKMYDTREWWTWYFNSPSFLPDVYFNWNPDRSLMSIYIGNQPEVSSTSKHAPCLLSAKQSRSKVSAISEVAEDAEVIEYTGD